MQVHSAPVVAFHPARRPTPVCTVADPLARAVQQSVIVDNKVGDLAPSASTRWRALVLSNTRSGLSQTAC